MRKLFWGCTAAAIAFVGGAWCAAHYATQHRSSLLARCLTGATQVAGTIRPAQGLQGTVIVTTDGGQPSAGLVDVDADGLPADPVPASEPADEHQPTVNPAVEGGSAPAVIVIPDQEPPAISLPGGALAVPQGGSTPDGPCEHHLAPPCSPTTMPYCAEDEDEPLPMPTLCDDSEQEDAGGCDHGCWWNFSWLKGGFRKMFADDQAEESADPIEIPPCWKNRQHPAPGACPGKPAETPGGEEASEPGVIRLRKKLRPHRTAQEEEDTPLHFEVDTMEHRPSDRSLRDYGPGAL